MNTSKYQKELAYLRPHDEIQDLTPSTTVIGTYYIQTAGHSYLAVPIRHTWHREARCMCSYGYMGRHAVYLETDCEAPAFEKRIAELEGVHMAQAVKVPTIAL